jgi:putative metalloprotease
VRNARRNVTRFILGLSLWAAAMAALPTPLFAAITEKVVQDAWVRVAEAAKMKPIPITYEKDKAPNAWVKFQSAEKFSVHVTQGLMKVLNSPHEIAGILGHEVGHVQCGHYGKSVNRNVGWAILGALLGEAGRAAEVVGGIGMNLAESGFSREQEVQADDYGMDLAVKAGYSPWGLYDAMKSFKDNGFKTEPNGFNSHPPTERRLKHLQQRAQKIERRK